jgi:ferritin-like metal-binding protein YciE
MSAETLKDALIEELRDMLHAEKQLTKAIPKMAKAAESEELSEAFTAHLEETQTHIQRLEEVLVALGETVRAKTCEGMKGIIEEGSEQIKENDAGPVRDAILIAAAQKVEHYEIASYGTIIAWAEQLELSEVAETLSVTLEEEKATDEKLTELSKTLNVQAEEEEEANA